MTRGINGFQPGRLSQVLAARRLSQVQLASMVGVKPPTVSKWRSGQQAPEADTLERLASVVNVAPEWFTRPISGEISSPLFRSNASAHVAAREMLAAHVEWVQDCAVALSEFIDFPALNFPERGFKEPDEIDDVEIERAADDCRELWKLGRGPIPDLALAIEGAGALLVREETGVAQIEGLSAWSHELARPIVLLSADKGNAFRSRFDLAHELGHLILHKHIPKTTESTKYKQMEMQAHRFAGAFLLPAERIATDIRTPVTLDSLLLLKQRWGVSVAAIIMRLEALKLIDGSEKQSLFKRRSQRWGAKAEPGDNARDPEQPRLLRRTIELLTSSGIVELSAIPAYFGLSDHDVAALTHLPVEYFRGAAEVVELAKLRPQFGPPDRRKTPRTDNVVQFSRRDKSKEDSSF